jgi:hypothetical protein
MSWDCEHPTRVLTGQRPVRRTGSLFTGLVALVLLQTASVRGVNAQCSAALTRAPFLEGARLPVWRGARPGPLMVTFVLSGHPHVFFLDGALWNFF